jgi:hypothetical protein
MKHATHLLMCAPMILVAAILLATGSGIAILLPLAGCMLMMALMMGAMGGDDGHGHGQTGRR